MSTGRPNADATKRLVYLELVVPHIDSDASRTKWLFWLNQDFPWTFREAWSVEYWGVRDRENTSTSWGQLRARGPRVLLRRLPWALLALAAWTTHFFMAMTRRRPAIFLARTPYLGAGVALAKMLRRRSTPLVVRIVEHMPSTAERAYGAWGIARLVDRIETFVLRRADLVVPIAGFTRGVAEKAGVPKVRIQELPNPPRWGRVEVPEIRKVTPPRVVTAARLIRGKAIDVLIRAFSTVASEFPDVVLDIAGEGKERLALEQLVNQLGIGERVQFHGWVPASRMPELFGAALIAALPSRVEEGHPMALREAALAGCALIGTDLGGIRDIVRPDRTGLLVPPEDARALADALRRLLADPEEAARLGEAARAEAVFYFERRDEALARVREKIYALASP